MGRSVAVARNPGECLGGVPPPKSMSARPRGSGEKLEVAAQRLGGGAKVLAVPPEQMGVQRAYKGGSDRPSAHHNAPILITPSIHLLLPQLPSCHMCRSSSSSAPHVPHPPVRCRLPGIRIAAQPGGHDGDAAIPRRVRTATSQVLRAPDSAVIRELITVMGRVSGGGSTLCWYT